MIDHSCKVRSVELEYKHIAHAHALNFLFLALLCCATDCHLSSENVNAKDSNEKSKDHTTIPLLGSSKTFPKVTRPLSFGEKRQMLLLARPQNMQKKQMKNFKS